MKTEFRMPRAECRTPRAASRLTHHASRITLHAPRHPRQSGVALVITLVLLSIITFMAVTFLVVTRSQHGAVANETDQAVAHLAANTAAQRAIADIIVPILESNNEFKNDLVVSTNTGGPTSLPQVLITLFSNGIPYLDNRFYLDLNRNGVFDPLIDGWGGDPEWVGVLQHPELSPLSPNNLFVARYAYIAVPANLDINHIYNDAQQADLSRGDGFLRNQGVLTAEMNLAALLVDINTNLWPPPSPGFANAPSQYGFSRYSYSVSPNGSMAFSSGAASDDARALLRYRYNTTFNNLASAAALLRNSAIAFSQDFIDRYSAGPVMLGTTWPVGPIDPTRSRAGFPWSASDNPYHFYTTQELFDRSKTGPLLPPRTAGFSDRLLMAGTNVDSPDIDSYNHYTFYRLLSVLGTDSAPEPSGKMNLNYCNVDNYGYVVPNMATNFIPWDPAQFFTNAAIRLLVDNGYTVGNANSTSNLLVTNYVGGILVTNIHIPIWPDNFYTPSVQRLFQLAANLYDAAQARPDGLPTVFRPLFHDTRGAKAGSFGQVFITGYVEPTPIEMTSTLVSAAFPPHDLTDPMDFTILGLVKPRDMVYGIPLVIGARKGLPNFNELAMQTFVQVTRKLQFQRRNLNGTDIHKDFDLNQMFVVGISNSFGVEAWNSYVTPYPRSLRVLVVPDLNVVVTITNNSSLAGPTTRSYLYRPAIPVVQNIAGDTWPGYAAWAPPQVQQLSFVTPLMTGTQPYISHTFLTNSTYSGSLNDFVPLTGLFDGAMKNRFYLPDFWINVRTRLRFALIDTVGNRLVDYVVLAQTNSLDTASALCTGGNCGTFYTANGSAGSMWCTNRMTGSAFNDAAWTFGIANQIGASQGNIQNVDWNNATTVNDKTSAINFFRTQFGMSLLSGSKGTYYLSNTFNAPYQPFRNFYMVTSWQANDPLVHYTVGDLTVLTGTNLDVDTLPTPAPMANLGQVNRRYEPWIGSAANSSSLTTQEPTIKDPLMLNADSWDFPTNKLPNIGWVGRVHRGTPWQTVYLKSPGLATTFATWQAWTGNGQTVVNVGQLDTNLVPLSVPGQYPFVAADAYFAQPTNDWRLLDLFTTALSDSATRGQLSINEANLAAWSAVLGGVIALTNNLDTYTLEPMPIQPAGVYNAADPTTWPPLLRIVNGINAARAARNPRHVFSRLSQILSVPELTVASPFLNASGTPSYGNNGLNDEAYERLPQQITGLLKLDPVPRYVIYAFGQTLKPAGSGAFDKSGVCNNYQIVAEAATRTVVRFEGVPPNRGDNPPPISALHPVVEGYNDLPAD